MMAVHVRACSRAVCKTVGSAYVGSNQTSAPSAGSGSPLKTAPSAATQRIKALQALLSRNIRCPSRDAWLHPAEGTQHAEARPVPTRQNNRFWMSATSRTIIVRGVPNGGSVSVPPTFPVTQCDV